MASQQPNVKRYNRGVSVNSVLNQGYVISKGSQTITVYEYDKNGDIVKATGTAAASTQNSLAGYAKGATYIDTDVATGSKALYENIGTTSSSSWNLIGDITAGEITLAEGSVLLGNSSGVAAALDVKTSGRIVVGNGTTGVLVAVSGDATLSSAGAVTVTGANAAFNIGTNETWAKEVNHNSTVTTTTTAATVGGSLTFTAGAGATTGSGGAISIVGGASGTGATGNGASAQVTGGAALSTDGNGGNVIHTPGAATGTGLQGNIFNRGTVVQKYTTTAMTDTATISAAGILGGLIKGTPTAAASYTMPTGTVLAAALPVFFTTGDSVDFTITNLATNDTFDITLLTAASGITLLSGYVVVEANSAATKFNFGTFRCVMTGANTFDVWRIA